MANVQRTSFGMSYQFTIPRKRAEGEHNSYATFSPIPCLPLCPVRHPPRYKQEMRDNEDRSGGTGVSQRSQAHVKYLSWISGNSLVARHALDDDSPRCCRWRCSPGRGRPTLSQISPWYGTHRYGASRPRQEGMRKWTLGGKRL